jgi:hypothetical protein
MYEAVLPPELLQVIMQHAIEEANTEDLLTLSGVCHKWYNDIDNGKFWLEKLRSENKYYIESHPEILTGDHVLSPKLLYSFMKKRQVHYLSHIQVPFKQDTARGTLPRYRPWIEHNLFKRPITLYDFIHTIIYDPIWLYFYVIEAVHRKWNYSQIDHSAQHKVSLLTLVLSVISLLPVVDNLFVLTRPVLADLLRTKSVLAFWKLQPWSIWLQIKMPLMLFPMTLAENSLLGSHVLPVRIILFIGMQFLCYGLKYVLLTALLTAVGYGLSVLYDLFIKKASTNPVISTPTSFAIAALIMSPLMSLVSILISGAVVFDWIGSFNGSKSQFRDAKYRLLLGLILLYILQLIQL